MIEFDEISNRVIGCAIEVHRELGPGLLESTYERCLCKELTLAGIPFQAQVPIPISYRGELLDQEYRADIVVDGQLILELKSIDRFQPLHTAQLLTYMKLGGYKTGLLINFNVNFLREGLKRVVL